MHTSEADVSPKEEGLIEEQRIFAEGLAHRFSDEKIVTGEALAEIQDEAGLWVDSRCVKAVIAGLAGFFALCAYGTFNDVSRNLLVGYALSWLSGAFLLRPDSFVRQFVYRWRLRRMLRRQVIR